MATCVGPGSGGALTWSVPLLPFVAVDYADSSRLLPKTAPRTPPATNTSSRARVPVLFTAARVNTPTSPPVLPLASPASTRQLSNVTLLGQLSADKSTASRRSSPRRRRASSRRPVLLVSSPIRVRSLFPLSSSTRLTPSLPLLPDGNKFTACDDGVETCTGSGDGKANSCGLKSDRTALYFSPSSPSLGRRALDVITHLGRRDGADIPTGSCVVAASCPSGTYADASTPPTILPPSFPLEIDASFVLQSTRPVLFATRAKRPVRVLAMAVLRGASLESFSPRRTTAFRATSARLRALFILTAVRSPLPSSLLSPSADDRCSPAGTRTCSECNYFARACTGGNIGQATAW